MNGSAICPSCNKEFNLKPHHASRKAKGYSTYCSVECAHVGQRKFYTMPCTCCDEEFTIKDVKRWRKYQDSGKAFCSVKCSTSGRMLDVPDDVECKWCKNTMTLNTTSRRSAYRTRGYVFCSRTCSGYAGRAARKSTSPKCIGTSEVQTKTKTQDIPMNNENPTQIESLGAFFEYAIAAFENYVAERNQYLVHLKHNILLTPEHKTEFTQMMMKNPGWSINTVSDTCIYKILIDGNDRPEVQKPSPTWGLTVNIAGVTLDMKIVKSGFGKPQAKVLAYILEHGAIDMAVKGMSKIFPPDVRTVMNQLASSHVLIKSSKVFRLNILMLTESDLSTILVKSINIAKDAVMECTVGSSSTYHDIDYSDISTDIKRIRIKQEPKEPTVGFPEHHEEESMSYEELDALTSPEIN